MKYELIKTGKLLPNGKPAFQVKRLSDGLLGGYVEGEHNLSQEGKCFIYDDAQVFENARVSDNARVSGDAQVYGDARVSDNARVYKNALVSDSAQVYGNARVSDNALVSVSAHVCGYALVYGNARVSGKARVSGNAQVCGSARVSDNAQVSDSTQVSDNAWVSKTPLNIASGLKNPITITETHIFIGCEGHTKEYWEENIWEIGKKHKYTEGEILKTIEILSVFN